MRRTDSKPDAATATASLPAFSCPRIPWGVQTLGHGYLWPLNASLRKARKARNRQPQHRSQARDGQQRALCRLHGHLQLDWFPLFVPYVIALNWGRSLTTRAATLPSELLIRIPRHSYSLYSHVGCRNVNSALVLR